MSANISALSRVTPPGAAAADASVLPAEVIALIESARKGDRSAFASLYARFAGMVHGILLARVDRADVGDFVQDVFLQAMTRLETLREPQAFGGWLAAMARNRAIDHVRRQWHTTPLPDEVAEQIPDSRTLRDGDRTEALAVLAVIRSMPEAYRETLIMRLVEGMTGPEIAALTGLTAGSVRVNLHRGMKLLRERLQGRSLA